MNGNFSPFPLCPLARLSPVLLEVLALRNYREGSLSFSLVFNL